MPRESRPALVDAVPVEKSRPPHVLEDQIPVDPRRAIVFPAGDRVHDWRAMVVAGEGLVPWWMEAYGLRLLWGSAPERRDPTTTLSRTKPMEAATSAPTRTPSTKRERDASSETIDRASLIDALNQDLAREYQAIIAYVVYSQVVTGARFMAIAKELERHAAEELDHALIIAKQIDYLGGSPTVEPKPVKTSDDAETMLRYDLKNEATTIRAYRERVRQCEALGEYAMAEHIRGILKAEQEHLIDLATALGEPPPKVDS